LARLQIQRINYFLRKILCRLFITSLNNPSQAPTQIILIWFLKSVEPSPGWAGPLYRSNSTCQHPVDFIYLLPSVPEPIPGSRWADHYNRSNPLVKLPANFISCPRHPVEAARAACPERTAHFTAFTAGVKKLFT